MKKATSRPKNVDEYLQQVQPEVRSKLKILRATIKKVVPEAEEKLSYGMPYYHFHGRLSYFASFKDHYSFFVMKHVLIKHNKEVKKYKTGEATLRFANDKDVPVKLITKLLKYGAKVNMEHESLKRKK